MIFLKHENFPDGYANIVRMYEHQRNEGVRTLKFPAEEYGEEVTPEQWMACAANQATQHRPFILTLDDGIRTNAVGRKAMRESGLSYVVFMHAWADEGFDSFAWRIVKYWPAIVERAAIAHTRGRQCFLEVSVRGRITVTNL